MSEKPDIWMEAAVDTPDAAIEAQKAGIDRVELCAALMKGGITPGPGMVKVLKKELKIPIFVLIRPRAGDFVYSHIEGDCMLEEVRFFREIGVDGLVFGGLREDGSLDEALMAALRHAAGPVSCTFHRAMDVCARPLEVLEQVIDLGFDRILTSGQAHSAEEGAANIAEWVEAAQGRIKIVAGGGIGYKNVADVLDQTGVTEVHFSAVRELPGQMAYKGADLFPGKTVPFPGKIKRVHNAIRAWQGVKFIG